MVSHLFLESPWRGQCGQRGTRRVLGGGGEVKLPRWKSRLLQSQLLFSVPFYSSVRWAQQMWSVKILSDHQYLLFSSYQASGRIHLCLLLLDLAGWLALPRWVTSGQKWLEAGTWFSVTCLPWCKNCGGMCQDETYDLAPQGIITKPSTC